jgi:hypothetical protein
LIADLASGHSLIEVRQRRELDQLYVTDWKSAPVLGPKRPIGRLPIGRIVIASPFHDSGQTLRQQRNIEDISTVYFFAWS